MARKSMRKHHRGGNLLPLSPAPVSGLATSHGPEEQPPNTEPVNLNLAEQAGGKKHRKSMRKHYRGGKKHHSSKRRHHGGSLLETALVPFGLFGLQKFFQGTRRVSKGVARVTKGVTGVTKEVTGVAKGVTKEVTGVAKGVTKGVRKTVKRVL
jgi:hypothetical protein